MSIIPDGSITEILSSDDIVSEIANVPHDELQGFISSLNTALSAEHDDDGLHRSSVSSIRDVSRNLVIENNSGTPLSQLDISADEVIMQNSDDKSLKFDVISETVNIATGGDGGLDTGSEANSTWYFIWLIGKTDGTVSSILSLSSTTPTMPSGYTYKALMGAIYNDSGGDFIVIRQEDDVVMIEEVTVLTAGGATSPTQVDISATVPSTAKRIIGTMTGIDNTSFTSATVTLETANALNKVTIRVILINIKMHSPFEASSDLYYWVGQATTTADVRISGWKY